VVKVDLVLVTIDIYTEQNLALHYGTSFSAKRMHSDGKKRLDIAQKSLDSHAEETSSREYKRREEWKLNVLFTSNVC